jgi:hypothetical protein
MLGWFLNDKARIVVCGLVVGRSFLIVRCCSFVVVIDRSLLVVVLCQAFRCELCGYSVFVAHAHVIFILIIMWYSCRLISMRLGVSRIEGDVALLFVDEMLLPRG